MGSTEVVFRSRRFHVERRELAVDGRPHSWDVVVHPGAVVVLPVLDDGRVVLIRNYRVAVDAALIEAPAGCLEPGEDPADCARRELAEETGYRAERIEPLATFFTSPGVFTERMHAFVARGLTPGATALESGEQINPAEMMWDDAISAIADGRIVDAKTIVALLYFERFVRRQD